MSSEETNRAIVLRNFRAFDSGDLRTLEETTALSFVDHNPLESQLPGVTGTEQASAIYRAAFPDAKIDVEDTIAEADKVVIRWSGHATHKGPFLDMPPTGKRVTLEGIAIFRVEKGKVAEQWGELNLYGILLQLGASSLDRRLQE
ncbi:MAG: ester cyclase [Halobacteriota archaeon]